MNEARKRTWSRKRIWIDPFQTGLLIRIALYCVVFQLAAWAFFAFCNLIDNHLTAIGADWPFFSNNIVRCVLALLVLVPPLTLDAIRFAHRLVGPLYRFRKTIQAIAAGEPVALVQLRQGDLLMDFKDDFNRMLQHLEQQGFVLVKASENSKTTQTPQPISPSASVTVGPES